VLPIARIVSVLAERGIETLVDGAHAPGMVPLDVAGLGATYYTGNCHKWICAPKGAGFLWVRRDRQPQIRPVTISHGANTVRADRSRYLLEFDWMGTVDPTPVLCVPEAIRFMGKLLPGGWSELMEWNRTQAMAARDRVCARLGIAHPAPDEMIGTLVAFPISDGSADPPASSLYIDPLQDELMDRFRIEVPVIPWPAPPKRVVRFSSQIYNRPDQYDQLAEALVLVLDHRE
jgi:isopenicillin-N epimerase